MLSFASLRSTLSAAAGLAVIGLFLQSAHAAVIGGSIIVRGTDPVIATYQGNSASFSDDLYLETASGSTFIFNNHASPVGSTANLGSFAVGTELIFRLHVNNTNEDWFSGPAIRNSDGKAHARVTDDWQPNESLVEFEDLRGTPADDHNGPFNDLVFSFTNTGTVVPEPQTYALFAAGVLMLLALQRRRTDL